MKGGNLKSFPLEHYPKLLEIFTKISNEYTGPVTSTLSPKLLKRIRTFFTYVPPEFHDAEQNVIKQAEQIFSYMKENPLKFLEHFSQNMKLRGGAVTVASNAVELYTGKRQMSIIKALIIDFLLSAVCFAVAYYLISNAVNDTHNKFKSLVDNSERDSILRHFDQFTPPTTIQQFFNKDAYKTFFYSILTALNKYSQQTFTNTANSIIGTDSESSATYGYFKLFFSAITTVTDETIPMKIVEQATEKIYLTSRLALNDLKSIQTGFTLAMIWPYRFIKIGVGLAAPGTTYLLYNSLDKSGKTIKNVSVYAFSKLKNLVPVKSGVQSNSSAPSGSNALIPATNNESSNDDDKPYNPMAVSETLKLLRIKNK
jgi:hypothetical protein